MVALFQGPNPQWGFQCTNINWKLSVLDRDLLSENFPTLAKENLTRNPSWYIANSFHNVIVRFLYFKLTTVGINFCEYIFFFHFISDLFFHTFLCLFSYIWWNFVTWIYFYVKIIPFVDIRLDMGMFCILVIIRIHASINFCIKRR